MHASFKHCCLFVLLIFFLIIACITFSVIFILKPRLPFFSVQTLRLDSYQLETFHPTSSSTLCLSSIASLFLNAQNPNKYFGLGYKPSKLHLLHGGVHIGTLRLPGFYQPPKEKNVSFRARVFLQSVNLSKVVEGNDVGVKLFGDVWGYVKISYVRLPSVKVGLDCGIGIDYEKMMNMVSSNSNSKYEMANLSQNHEPVFKNCSFTFYI